jgi:hypothetical protein
MFELFTSSHAAVVAYAVIDRRSRDWVWRFAGVSFSTEGWELGLRRVVSEHSLHRCCLPDRVFGYRELMRRPLFASNVEWYVRMSPHV